VRKRGDAIRVGARTPIKRMRLIIGSRLTAAGLLLTASCLLLSCSIPSLEEPECTQARDVVREFYSLHFANGTDISRENSKARDILTPRLIQDLQASSAEVDPFTLVNRSANPPKAFRVAGCVVTEPNKSVSFTLLLFWKDDVKSEQREIGVVAEKQNDKWLIDGVRSIGPINKL
jgi:hypothetical protein